MSIEYLSFFWQKYIIFIIYIAIKKREIILWRLVRTGSFGLVKF